MNHIQIKIDHETLTAQTERPLVAQAVGVTSFTAEFDESWEGYVKTIIFTAGGTGDRRSWAVLYTGGEMQVPWEALEEPGELSVSACGAAEGRTQPTALMENYLRVLANGETAGEAAREATPEVWQQVLTEVGAVREGVEAVDTAAASAEAAASNAFGSMQAAQSCLDAARQEREGAEMARDTAVSAAERVLSSAFLSVKMNGTELPIRDNSVDIPVPTEEQVQEMASGTVEKLLQPLKVVTVSLPASGWSNTVPYTQTVNIAGMNAAWLPGIPVLASGGSMEANLAAKDALACVSLITSGTNFLRFTCYEEKPTSNINIRIPGMLE